MCVWEMKRALTAAGLYAHATMGGRSKSGHAAAPAPCMALAPALFTVKSVSHRCPSDSKCLSTYTCASQTDIRSLLTTSCGRPQDHHCLFLGTCIGRRNHRHFLVLLFTAIVGCLYALVCCACLLAKRYREVEPPPGSLS